MSNPLLTIAIPTYNRADLLDLCLGRIVAQLPADNSVELLVSNNASTDHTQQIVAKYQAQYPAIRYSENERNGGPDFNIAKSFELATGKYVWVFSDDDILLPEALDHVLPLLSQQQLGIVVLQTAFYRHSIHEFVPPRAPLAYSLYDDPAQLATEIHFWLTYISGIITNKELVANAPTLYQYQNSFMIQLGWVIPALFQAKLSARITTPLVLGRALEVLDFKLFHVFGTSYPLVLEDLARQGVLPAQTKEKLIELIIQVYFPEYIKASVRYAHGERPLFTLSKSFWKRRSFWSKLVPLFVRRHAVLSLEPLRDKFRQLLATAYGRLAALHQQTQAVALAKQLSHCGPDSPLPAQCQITNPQYVAIGRGLRAQAGLHIVAHSSQGGKVYTPRIEIGSHVRMGNDCQLDCCERIRIGNWVLIGSRVGIVDNILDDSSRALDYPPTNRPLVAQGPIEIADNVLIEDDVRILSGVTIGSNAIIRAGSVVRDSVPANAVVAGSPARLVSPTSLSGTTMPVAG